MIGILAKQLEDRVILVSRFVAETGCTVRKTGKHFGIARMTVYSYVTKRIFDINMDLYVKCDLSLLRNKEKRSSRGGERTKQKFAKIKEDLLNAELVVPEIVPDDFVNEEQLMLMQGEEIDMFSREPIVYLTIDEMNRLGLV